MSPLPPEYVEAMLARIPLGRASGPDDAPNAILFLCSPQASFITGATLAVDGGNGLGTVDPTVGEAGGGPAGPPSARRADLAPVTRRPVLAVEGLGVAIGPTRVVDGVTFDLAAGEIHALVGESGCGKSHDGVRDHAACSRPSPAASAAASCSRAPTSWRSPRPRCAGSAAAASRSSSRSRPARSTRS